MRFIRSKRRSGLIFCLLTAFCLGGCDDTLNNPRPLSDYAQKTIFSTFSLSPKTVDPQASYSRDETPFVYLCYEPPYGYHYLKRPYEIVPNTVEQVVRPEYLDASGKTIAQDAEGQSIAWSRYTLRFKKGILFAPHPAFARDASGRYLYHDLDAKRAASLQSPLQLPSHATRELTADDYLYGIKRIASPRVVSPILNVIGEYMPGLLELAKTLSEREEINRRKGRQERWLDLRTSALNGVRVLDRYTLQIDIKGKYPQFSNWLAMSFFAPVPWEAEAFYANPELEKNNISLRTWPVGTGPYRAVKMQLNREHVLEKNPQYHGSTYPCEGEATDRSAGLLEACSRPLPFVDRIVFTMEKESVPKTSKFLQGYYDNPAIIRQDSGLGFIVAAMDYPDKARLYRERHLKFPKSICAEMSYMGFNWLDPVVGEGRTPQERERNRKLRQAISIAVDWEEEISIFLLGQGSAAHGPIPPGMFGWSETGATAFNPIVYRKDAEGRIVRRSIEEARSLMREAGYPDGRDARTGKPLVLHFDWQGAAASSKSYLEWMTKQFAKIGIQLEIRATDYNRFQDKMRKGAAQIFIWGWLGDYPDAENFLFLLYGGNAKVAHKGENAANYVNAQYDALYERMKLLDAGPEKAYLIDQMVRIVQEDAPWSFGVFPAAASAMHNWVKNAKPSQYSQNALMYYDIDAVERVARIREWNRPVLWPVGLLLVLIVGFVWLVRNHIARMRNRCAKGES